MSESTNNFSEFEGQEDLNKLQGRAWAVGILGAVGLVAGFFLSDPPHNDFYRAYLVAWVFCLSMPAGLLALTMLGHVSGGAWGVMLRRLAEAAGRTLPFLFLLGLPLVSGLKVLYPWARPEVVEHDALLQHKAIYLNVDFFCLRTLLYFAFLSSMAWILSGLARRYDESGDAAVLERMKKWSAFGLVFHVLLSTFMAVDWMMSLDPHWFSSLFGAAFVVGQVLAAFCFSVVALGYLHTREPFKRLVQPKLFHDYGKLMLAFIAVWAYFSFSQFLIIWSGNLPEEISWYLDRTQHGWTLVSRLLVLGHFVLPFILLLSADLKKMPRLISLVALWILAMRWFDYYWLVAPSLHPEGVTLGWIDVVAPCGLVGLWLGLLVWQFKSRPPLPYRHPLLEEIANHD
jgi:hypothetical protein